ncbi:g_PROTEIN_RECEP_F1_2 domain-containing protein [Trichonephila inaurata madagascariensis]|uniref:G_PROTEIN_RECEP_F1_2 domain-containing protein n=1 Tax=Trichonephila inaurata madagascariensis TaxID=2747483 RepID=A0A8X6X881_9ARAC|nr:g_PROTEIN_RECEP_F1_2 domain-containing protein [Trichonephila inaurata madagascariensis]
MVAWFPYAIVCLFEAYGDPELLPRICRILAALFCKTAAATNPIIYLFMSKGFRREVTETTYRSKCSFWKSKMFEMVYTGMKLFLVRITSWCGKEEMYSSA